MKIILCIGLASAGAYLTIMLPGVAFVLGVLLAVIGAIAGTNLSGGKNG